MRSKLLNGVNMKIAAATSVVIFTLLVSFVGIYAWFSTVKNIDNTTNSFKVEQLNGAVTGFTVHEYYGVTSDGSTWGFNPTPKKTVRLDQPAGEGTLTMGSYSLDNPDHPALILFEVNGSYETIIAKTDSVYLASEEATLQSENNPLSSVIEAYSLSFSSDPKIATTTGNLVDESGQTSSKTYMSISTSINENKSSFVSFNSNNDPSFSSKATFFDGDISGKSYVGVVINYNTDSLVYISSYYLGNSLLLDGLEYTCDWTLEV